MPFVTVIVLLLALLALVIGVVLLIAWRRGLVKSDTLGAMAAIASVVSLIVAFAAVIAAIQTIQPPPPPTATNSPPLTVAPPIAPSQTSPVPSSPPSSTSIPPTALSAVASATATQVGESIVRPRLADAFFGYTFDESVVHANYATQEKIIGTVNRISMIPVGVYAIGVSMTVDLPSNWDRENTEFVIKIFRDNVEVEAKPGQPVQPIHITCRGGDACAFSSIYSSPKSVDEGDYEFKVYLDGVQIDGKPAIVTVTSATSLDRLNLFLCNPPLKRNYGEQCNDFVFNPAKLPRHTRYVNSKFSYVNMPVGTEWFVELVESATESVVSRIKFLVTVRNGLNTPTPDGAEVWLVLTQEGNTLSGPTFAVLRKADESPLTPGQYELRLVMNGEVKQSLTFEIE